MPRCPARLTASAVRRGCRRAFLVTSLHDKEVTHRQVKRPHPIGFARSHLLLCPIYVTGRRSQDTITWARVAACFDPNLHQDLCPPCVTESRVVAANLSRVSSQLIRSGESLNPILLSIKNGKGTAGKLVHDDKLSNHLDSLGVNLNALAKDVRENPKRYFKMSVF